MAAAFLGNWQLIKISTSIMALWLSILNLPSLNLVALTQKENPLLTSYNFLPWGSTSRINILKSLQFCFQWGWCIFKEECSTLKSYYSILSLLSSTCWFSKFGYVASPLWVSFSSFLRLNETKKSKVFSGNYKVRINSRNWNSYSAWTGALFFIWNFYILKIWVTYNFTPLSSKLVNSLGSWITKFK